MKHVKQNHPFGNTSLINWIFDDVLIKDAFQNGSNSHSVLSALNRPRTNILENENSYTLEIAAPGLNKSDFNINLKENAISISASVKEKNEEEKRNYKSREFNFSTFERTFKLPKHTDIENISADYTNGLLSVELPIKNEIKKSIEITVK